MRLIEADKVEQAIKDYWKAQVDKALTLTDGNEKRINIYLEHNHELLKAIDELPSAEPYTTTHDSIPAENGRNDGDRTSGDCISRQVAIDALLGITAMRNTIPLDSAIFNIKKLPSAQPNHCAEVGKKVLIDRQEALEKIRTMQTYKLFAGDDMILIDKAQVQTELMMLPPVQPERPTGEWIQKPRYEDDEYPDAQPNLKCPFCGYEIGWCDMGNYCARCGADLKGGAV